MTPSPMFGFPGLKDGDRWCLCALRWKEALASGKAPPVDLAATHQHALDGGFGISMEVLKEHSVDAGAPSEDSESGGEKSADL